MRRAVTVAVLVAGALVLTPPIDAQEFCGTPPPSPEQLQAFQAALAGHRTKAIAGPVAIPVAFHAINDGRNGKIPRQNIDVLVNNLNWAFQNTPFSFYLYKVTSTKKKPWYQNCAPGSKNEAAMKNKLAVDTRYVLNIYSCNPGGLGGFAYYPFVPSLPNGHKLHGVVLHPGVVPGGSWDGQFWPYGLPAAHEVGHYLGLLHTFEGGCDEPGDFIADTPQQFGPMNGSCPVGVDTCNAPGLDDVRNFMNYSTDECLEHFTSEQTGRMIDAVETFRPTLLP